MMTESVTVTVQDGSRAGAAKADGGQSNPLASLTVNLPYFRSIPGIIKLVQLVLGIICMACSSPTHGAGGWFVFVSVTAFIMTLIWCILYLFSIREALKLPINWILTELINTGIYTALYLTAFITQLAWAGYAPHIVAGVFGLFNTIAYGLGTYFLLLEHKNSQQ